LKIKKAQEQLWKEREREAPHEEVLTKDPDELEVLLFTELRVINK
jgi:hypothetical protein